MSDPTRQAVRHPAATIVAHEIINTQVHAPDIPSVIYVGTESIPAASIDPSSTNQRKQ